MADQKISARTNKVSLTGTEKIPVGETDASITPNQIIALVTDASDTVKGLVELATSAETVTGSSTALASTPAGVKAAIDALIAAAPGALNTLDELAAALGDDANYAATITAALALKEVKLDAVSVTTTGGTITLDLNSLRQRIFNGATSFTGAKTIALSNGTNALVLTFNFQITGSGCAITFPAAFKSSDARFTTSVLTLTGAGFYEVTAVYDSVSSIWKLKAEINGGVI